MKIENSSVLTTADLAAWSFAGTALAVLGHPVRHSISPAMHNAALAVMAGRNPRFADWRYFCFDVPPEELPDALPLFLARGFRGLNLTVPHKVIAFGQLKSAHIDSAARPIGAVNTLLNDGTHWLGHNTDGYGLATAVSESFGRGLPGADVILLGAGGAARGAAVECGRQQCRSLWIANRTAANRDALLRDLGLPAWAQGFDPAAPPPDLPRGALVVNATSAGLHADDAPPIDLARLPRPAGVYDMIYNPPETKLLAQARALGLPAANGLSMLVHQGARSLEIWSGATVPVEAMRTAAAAALAPA